MEGRHSSPRDGQRSAEGWQPETDAGAADPERGPTEARQDRERKERPSPQGSPRHKRGRPDLSQEGGAARRMPPSGSRGPGDDGTPQLGRPEAGPNDRSDAGGRDTRPAANRSDGERQPCRPTETPCTGLGAQEGRIAATRPTRSERQSRAERAESARGQTEAGRPGRTDAPSRAKRVCERRPTASWPPASLRGAKRLAESTPPRRRRSQPRMRLLSRRATRWPPRPDKQRGQGCPPPLQSDRDYTRGLPAPRRFPATG